MNKYIGFFLNIPEIKNLGKVIFYRVYRNSDEKFLKLKFKLLLGHKLNLENPQTFNEKIQWLKLHDHNPEYIRMVDKYEAKKYVAEKIGEEYIIPTFGVWDKFDDIDFNLLPDQFVLKCTHDSGSLIICKNKSIFNKKKARKKMNKCMRRNYYWGGREWPYKNVRPRILAEQYLEGASCDYKIMCFNGKVKCAFVCSERFSEDGLKVTFFDRNWNKMPFERHYPKSNEIIEKPKEYDQMITLAERLAAEIPFVRVDFYESDEKLYFGEMTFYPGSGFEEFTPESADFMMGEWIKLPSRGGIGLT